MKRIKILQVNKLYYPAIGGIETVVKNIAENLNGCTDMKVLVCQKSGKASMDVVSGVKVTRATSFGTFYSMPISLDFLVKMHKAAREADIVVCHMPFPLGDLGCLLSRTKKKVVVWWHSDIVRQKKLMLFYKPIMEIFLKRADVIIAATEGHIEYSTYLTPYKNKCVVIPYGVEQKFVEDSKAYCFKRKKENEEIVFLFVGRFVYYKGCDVLIKAFANTHSSKLIMAGSGILENELRKLCKELNIEDRVEFVILPTDNQIMELYRKCDVFVLPSTEKSEAFGLVQLEAMCYGKPVINTRLKSGVPYVSIDDLTGITVEPKNQQQLADAIQRLTDNTAEREQFGKAAKKRVLENFTMNSSMNKFYKCISELNSK